MRNLKKLLALVLTIALACSLVLPAFAKPIKDFADGDASAAVLKKYGALEGTYTRAVQFLIDLEAVKGDAATSDLRLGKTLTRGEFVTLLYNVKTGNETIEDYWKTREMPFSDVAKGSWVYPYVAWAFNNGYVKGTGANTFEAAREISFNDGMILILNALGYDEDREWRNTYNPSALQEIPYSERVARMLVHAYQLGVVGNVVPLEENFSDARNTYLINRADAFVLFNQYIALPQIVYTYDSVRTDNGQTILEGVFGCVRGVFTVVTDGVYFGLPSISNYVSATETVNNGGLDQGRAIIQRPYKWDRRTGTVEEWDTYILSADDTKALGINLKSVGQKIGITFKHPDLEYSTHYANDDYRPGQYHRLNIEKIYGDIEWLSEVTTLDNIDGGWAGRLNGGLSGRTFIDYTNDRTRLLDLWNEDNTSNNKIDTGDNNKIKENAWANADIRVVSYDGNVEYVFIENYVVQKYVGSDDWWDWGESNPQLIIDGGYSNSYVYNDGNWWGWGRGAVATRQLVTEGKFSEGDYIALAPIIGSLTWGEWDSRVGHGCTDGYYLAQEVKDRDTGHVTSVRYDADDYSGEGGELLENGTGKGNLTMGSKTYVMSASWGSRLLSFNSMDNKIDRTVVLWHGQVVDVLRPSVPSTYCVVEAAGIKMHSSYNPNSRYADYLVDIVLEDGSVRRNLILDSIYSTANAHRTELKITGDLQDEEFAWGARATAGSLDPEDNDEIYYVGSNDPTKSLIFATPTSIAGHIFRYSLNGNRVTLYEYNADGDDVTGRVVGTQNGRFNNTWGSVLGKTVGMSSTQGLLTSSNTVVLVKSLDAYGRAKYRVYNRSIPGFDIPGGRSIYTEALLGSENGQLEDLGKSGAYVRFAYIDATDSGIESISKTYWAVALETGYDRTVNGERIGYIKALTSAGEVEITTVEQDAWGRNPLRYLRKGHVFTYDSEDGSVERVTNIDMQTADAIVSGIDNTGYFTVQAYDEDKWDSGGYWGTFGNNYVVTNKVAKARVSNAELKQAMDGDDYRDPKWFNVYIFDENSTTNYTNGTEVLVVSNNFIGNNLPPAYNP